MQPSFLNVLLIRYRTPTCTVSNAHPLGKYLSSFISSERVKLQFGKMLAPISLPSSDILNLLSSRKERCQYYYEQMQKLATVQSAVIVEALLQYLTLRCVASLNMLSDVKASDQCINVSFMVVMFVQRLRATW
jgi:hypothetical protein